MKFQTDFRNKARGAQDQRSCSIDDCGVTIRTARSPLESDCERLIVGAKVSRVCVVFIH